MSIGMRNPELVFKTTSLDAIAWYTNLTVLRKEELALRIAFEDEMLGLYGPAQAAEYLWERDEEGNKIPPTRRALWVQGDIAYALQSGYNERPPEDSGWRLDSKDHNWQPKLATKAGKEWRRRLSELNLVRMRGRWQEIGIPFLYWGERFIYNPGMSFDEATDTLYIGWGTQYAKDQFLKETSAKEGIDVVWEHIPLSEYHAWAETQEKPDDE